MRASARRPSKRSPTNARRQRRKAFRARANVAKSAAATGSPRKRRSAAAAESARRDRFSARGFLHERSNGPFRFAALFGRWVGEDVQRKPVEQGVQGEGA